MGIVVDREIAASTPCHGYEWEGEKLLWSEGVIGALSDPQEKIFCTNVKIVGRNKKEIPPKLKKRWGFFKHASKKCSVQTRGMKPRLPKFLGCMSKEAEKTGVEI